MSVTGQITKVHPAKVCSQCGASFWKPAKLSRTQWEQRRHCSNHCRGMADRTHLRAPEQGRQKVWHNGEVRWRYHVVMEEKIGRPLRPGEVVDHIDGNPLNDAPENLRLFASHAEHMANHWREGTLVKPPGMGGSRVVRASSIPGEETDGRVGGAGRDRQAG